MGSLYRSGLAFFSRSPVIHPFLFAVFPIFFLWAQNVEEFSEFSDPLSFAVPILISLAFTVVALPIATLILRDVRKAGLVVVLILVAFFAYGHVYNFIVESDIIGFPRQRNFLVGWLIFFMIIGPLSLFIRSDLRGTTNSLNAIAAILVAFSLITIIGDKVGGGSDVPSRSNLAGSDLVVGGGQPDFLPDVYYIIPDAFTSPGNFKDTLGEDLGVFTRFLKDRGFYVSDQARSNYSHTTTSLASSLNMEHIAYLADVMPEGSIDPVPLADLIRKNSVFEFFRSQGYEIVHTRESWVLEETDDELINCAAHVLTSFHADDFSGALIRTTALEPVLKFFDVLESRLQSQALCEFSAIVDANTKFEGPKFVFAHLFVPHPPYIFGRNGEDVSGGTSTTDYSLDQLYVDQSVFVANELQKVVERLLADPAYEPIIIIQGDHGTAFGGDSYEVDNYFERMGILNAYHLPRGGNDDLYESITPVNSFRVVLNHYFGTELELLPDTNYFTNTGIGKFNFKDVTNILDGSPSSTTPVKDP